MLQAKKEHSAGGLLAMVRGMLDEVKQELEKGNGREREREEMRKGGRED